jgi:hypothetical protein
VVHVPTVAAEPPPIEAPAEPPAAAPPPEAAPPTLASPEDVAHAYRLVLGRNPESEAVVAVNHSRPPARTVEVLLHSAEFERAVLGRLATDRPPPHAELPEGPLAATLAWAVALGLVAPGVAGDIEGPTARRLLHALALSPAARAVHGDGFIAAVRAATTLGAGEGAGPPPPPARAYAPLACGADVLAWSEDGIFAEGWLDDRVNPAVALQLRDPSGAVATLPAWRSRRLDAEGHLALANPAELGLWTAALLPYPANAAGLELAVVHRHGGTVTPFAPAQRLALSRREFLEHVLAYFGRRAVIGGAAARGFAELDGPLGPLIEGLHGRLAGTRAVTARGDFRHGAAPAGKPLLSLVCVLYGVPDFLHLLVSQFARFAPLGEVEFLFACNSPEMEEAVLRDAELAAFTFRTTVRVIGPDVFPRHAAAVHRLFALAREGLGQRLVGGRLFYADGTVMHDGMVIEADARLAAQTGGRPALLVEHLRKGFPDRPEDAAPRPVPAVSGALMLMDRGMARDLGPFDEGFVFGHYEDADLCLRLAQSGGEVLVDPALSFWHYEGRGSITRPEHAGSAMFNRWRFSRRWGARQGG